MGRLLASAQKKACHKIGNSCRAEFTAGAQVLRGSLKDLEILALVPISQTGAFTVLRPR